MRQLSAVILLVCLALWGSAPTPTAQQRAGLSPRSVVEAVESQKDDDPTAWTDAEKMQFITIQLQAKSYEKDFTNAQLSAQLAKLRYDQAQMQIAALLKTLDREGYTLVTDPCCSRTKAEESKSLAAPTKK